MTIDPDSFAVFGELQLGVNGSRDTFVGIHATRTAPGSLPGDLGDVAICSAPGATGIYQHNGTSWSTVASAVPSTTYNVLEAGLVGDGATDNRAALTSLITSVDAAGGGTIFFPAGRYVFVHSGSVCVPLQSKNNITFAGVGRRSKLIWNGTLGGSGHFFSVEHGCKFIAFENLALHEGTGSKTDPAEQHHLIKIGPVPNVSTLTTNTEHVRVMNCYFGETPGDAVNMAGSLASTACHAAIAANSASGPVSGPFTQPIEAQRVCVVFQAGWDGGNFTFSGNNASGIAISETIASSPGNTVLSELEFATISGVTKSAQGATSNTATLGFAYLARNLQVTGCVFNGFDYTEHGGNLDNDNGYRSAIGVQRMTDEVHIQRNWMTGCGDQLIDFEPTGNGDLGRYDISFNRIICANPRQGLGVSLVAMSFWGNGEVVGQNNRRSRVAFNHLYGHLGGGKCSGCDIIHNHIYTVPGDNTGAINLSGRCDDLTIAGNRIYVDATSGASPINLAKNNGVAGTGVKILNNFCEWYSGRGIAVEGGIDVEVSGNVLRYLAATTNTDKGIVVLDAASTPIKRVVVSRNQILGNAGGGTLQHGVSIVNSAGNTDGPLLVHGNQGVGVQTDGVHIESATTWASPPVIADNDFTGATNPVKLPTGTIVAIAGNGGGIMWFVSTAADPNTLSGLDGVPLGSLYSGQGSGAVYRKNAAGGSGWVTV